MTLSNKKHKEKDLFIRFSSADTQGLYGWYFISSGRNINHPIQFIDGPIQISGTHKIPYLEIIEE